MPAGWASGAVSVLPSTGINVSLWRSAVRFPCRSRGNDPESPAVHDEVETRNARQHRNNESTQSVLGINEAKLNARIEDRNDHRNEKHRRTQNPSTRQPFGGSALLFRHPQPPDQRHHDYSRYRESYIWANKLTYGFLETPRDYQERPDLQHKIDRKGPEQPSPKTKSHRPAELLRS